MAQWPDNGTTWKLDLKESMKTLNRLITLLLLIFADSNSGGKEMAALEPPRSKWTPLFLSSDAQKLGFKITNKTIFGAPNKWEIERTQAIQRFSTRLKSKFPSHLGKDSFYRFYVEEEIYPDSILAQSRLDSLFEEPPRMRPEDRKAFPLREGFRKGNRVIVVGTDVAAYERKLGEMKSALHRLATNPDTKHRARLLDSLGKTLRVPKP